jgi:hypothetical protein
MRVTFDTHGGGGGAAYPANSARGPRISAVALFLLFGLAFGWGILIAAAFDTLSDMQARGVMDSSW